MNNNCDDHDTYHIFNLIGQHTELHLILSAASTARVPYFKCSCSYYALF